MKDQILEAIKSQNGKITFKNLSKKFDIDTRELNKILLDLKLEAKILQLGNKYMAFPDGLNVGTVCVSQTGKKYIYHNDEKISVAANFLNELILNDVVSFKIDENGEAEIVSIVDRPLGKVTCEVKVIDGKKKLMPFYSDMNFTLPNDVMDTLYDGDIIVVDTTPNELFDYVNATFVRKIGRRDDPISRDVAIALNVGFDNNYSDEYMEEVYKLPTEVHEEETVGRYDYRNQECFTIDGKDTKDMDDGVYGEKLDDDIIRVYVHISDVSHYVKIGSKLFERACEKTTSLYLNNSVFHMFHHIISNGICSLNPDKDRLTKTVVFDIDKNGNILNYDIQKSVIKSRKKMTYDDVDLVICGNTPEDYKKYEKTLWTLYSAAMRLEKKFTQSYGKLNFAETELDVDYNNDGSIKTINDPTDSVSRKIIENLMIGANACVADWFVNLDIPTVYRVHEFPNIKRINDAIKQLNKEGFHIKQIENDLDLTASMQRLLQKLSSYSEFPIISQRLVMAMKRAKYSIENVGHYALGLSAYCHFTSPIRRLADLLVHMMIDLVLVDYDKLNEEKLAEYKYMLSYLAEDASKKERQANEAERIAEQLLILDKLEKHQNEELEATVIELGAKIKLRVEGVDTYVNLNELDSIFAFNKKRKLYYDKETNQHVKVGTKLYVKVTSLSSIGGYFNVIVTGMVRDTNVKKKILIK